MKLTGYRKDREVFKEKLGYDLNLHDPKSFNEKIIWKEIHDRNPLIAYTSDKYLARKYVENILGKKDAERILIPILCVTKDPESIPFDSLPADYVIKSTHGSARNIIVEGKNINRDEVITQYRKWLKEPYAFIEWGYQKNEPKILIEELLKDDDGNMAQDYKFHMFLGKCGFIHTTPKKSGERTGQRSLFSPEWDLLPVGWKYAPGPYIDPPECLPDMLRIAKQLSAPFDYVRVDLYCVSGRLYFGELTHYHGGGKEKFDPQSFDFELGKLWDIIPKYWLKK